METFLIGNKYDILENIDIEKLKWLCPSLRFFSFINALNLIFILRKKKKLLIHYIIQWLNMLLEVEKKKI